MGEISSSRTDHIVIMAQIAQTVEAGKPNKGFGGARRLYGDLRDNYPETFKHLEGQLNAKGGGSMFKSQAEQIADAKKRMKAKQKPLTEEEKEEKERAKKITMLRHKSGVGGRRTPNGGFFT